MFDTIFAFFHLLLLLGLIGYAFYSLIQGSTLRFVLIIICLAGYYFLALHKNVKNEIKRKKKSKS